MKTRRFLLLLVSLGIASSGSSQAEDWPTYRHDNRRSAVSTESLGSSLTLRWEYRSMHPPKPAWPMPAEELPRMHSDGAFHVAVAGGKVYFGSSVTDELTCVDAASGEILWTFSTEGPIRNTPTVAGTRVYVGSDDGYVYCLDAQTGSLRWRYRPGPNDRKIIGNGRMISRWPIRTNVLVDDGIAYFGAGVFPHEGIYICALDAEEGTVVWRNDRVGTRSHELKFGGISPQGNLLASSDTLYVPSGRAIPAAFDRKTGKLRFSMSPSGDPWSYNFGGNWSALDGNKIVLGVERHGTPVKIAYDAKQGKRRGDLYGWFPGIDMVLTSGTAYVLTLDGVYAVDRTLFSEDDLAEADAAGKQMKILSLKLRGLRKNLERLKDLSKGKELSNQIAAVSGKIKRLEDEESKLRKRSAKWHCPMTDGCAIILAGDALYAGSKGRITRIDINGGNQVWQTRVTGRPLSLAVANGCLLASTDTGSIFCYGRGGASPPRAIDRELAEDPYADERDRMLYRSAAQTIVEQTNVKKGWCLVVGCGTGCLANELARRTDLKVLGLERDPKKLAIARRRLAEAGHLGSRVAVEPWGIASLPDYFANLVVSEEMLTTGVCPVSVAQIARVLRPYGGVSLLGARTGREISWQRRDRGKLSGAGSWTHIYGNTRNTGSSGDELVKGPLEVLWFGEPGPIGMVDRHFSGPPPLSAKGRLFVHGQKGMKAYDAYNGTLLWAKDLPVEDIQRAAGVHHRGTNVAMTEAALFVAIDSRCYQLDPATGETVHIHGVPPALKTHRRWGTLLCAGDTLVGTAGFLTEGHSIFAIDTSTGKSRWLHRGSGISHISITMANEGLFFLKAEIDPARRKQALSERERLIKDGRYIEGAEREFGPDRMDVRKAVLLDLETGNPIWESSLDLTDCGPRLPNWRKAAGGAKHPYVGAAYAEGLLVFYGHFGNHDAHMFDWSKPQQSERRITAISAKDGRVVWSRPLHYLQKPIVVGSRIVVMPRVCDLRTGQLVMRDHPVTGRKVQLEVIRPGHSCGAISASAHTLFYRSDSIGIYGLTEDSGLDIFGTVRPGCWLNIIPAGGVVVIPEASSGCTCSYPLKCSLALAPQSRRPLGNWAIFPTHGAMTPVKHLAINVGAPGDMRDSEGTVWLAYPRPKTKGSSKGYYRGYGVNLDFSDKRSPGARYFYRDPRRGDLAESDRPGLLCSGLEGNLSWEIPLIDSSAGQKPGFYTARLGLSAAASDKPGDRVFDVIIQGEAKLRGLDIVKALGSTRELMNKDFARIKVENVLTIELVGQSSPGSKGLPPRVNCLEVIREDDG